MSLSDRSAHPSAGGAVEVFSEFDECWYRGFQIRDAVVDESGVVGYHVARMSDRSVPPALFKAADIRSESSGRDASEVSSRVAGA